MYRVALRGGYLTRDCNLAIFTEYTRKYLTLGFYCIRNTDFFMESLKK